MGTYFEMLLQVKVILFVLHMLMRRNGSIQVQLSLFTALTVLNVRGHIFEVTSKAAQVCRYSKSRWLDPFVQTLTISQRSCERSPLRDTLGPQQRR